MVAIADISEHYARQVCVYGTAMLVRSASHRSKARVVYVVLQQFLWCVAHRTAQSVLQNDSGIRTRGVEWAFALVGLYTTAVCMYVPGTRYHQVHQTAVSSYQVGTAAQQYTKTFQRIYVEFRRCFWKNRKSSFSKTETVKSNFKILFPPTPIKKHSRTWFLCGGGVGSAGRHPPPCHSIQLFSRDSKLRPRPTKQAQSNHG